MAFSKDGKLFASSSLDRKVRLYDLHGSLFHHTEPPSLTHILDAEHEVYSVAFSPDSKLLASGSLDKKVRVYAVSPVQLEPKYVLEHQDWVFSVAFSVDSKLLASGSNDGTVCVYAL